MATLDKIAVLTSGGDAPGMNAAIRAVVRKGIYHNLKVFGIYHGYEGLIKGHIKPMDLRSVGDIIHRGGTILRTARSEEMLTEAGQQKAASQLKERGIGALVVIGGDGSYRGAQKLAHLGINVVGIPGTIDNDIVGTDMTIGFDTTVNTVIEAVSKIRDTATSHERTFLVEVMGRNCGDITLRAGLAIGAESILIPEIEYDLKEVSEKLIKGFKRGKNHSIIIAAEGAGDIMDISARLKEYTGLENKVTILGHVQRGGAPSAYDSVLAATMGGKAIEVILEGKSEVMISLCKNEIVAKPLHIAFEPRKGTFPRHLYDLANELSI